MCAEARALLQGLDKGITLIDMEVDSLILMNIIQRKASTPWAITYEIRQNFYLLDQLDYVLFRTFRESNTTADLLTNLGCKEGQVL